MSPASPAAALVHPAAGSLDWRSRRLTTLMGEGWSAGEWDSERQLILPRPGGQLTRVLRCSVTGCPADRYGSELLCHTHRRQFAASAMTDVEGWLASDKPAPFERRWCAERRCQVTGAAGRGCPRPAEGEWRLCAAHSDAWRRRRARGSGFAEFCSRARPLPELGPCRAACCYRDAAHRESGLCSVHYQMWRSDGCPRGAAFARWKAHVRQPVNSRVLSLRGLPALVRLELVYAIGCRAAEQVSVVTGGMRPWVDQLRVLRVGSVTEFDLGLLDGVGDAGHVRFARFSVDRVRLAYADEDDERRRDIWDLRLFGRCGRLDFTAIRQGWLREATKAWTAVTLGRITEQTVRHRVGSLAALSAVLAAGPGGGADPAALTRADIDRFLAPRVESVGRIRG